MYFGITIWRDALGQNFIVILKLLHRKHVVEPDICVPIQHLLYSRGKCRKTLIDFGDRRTFWMHSNFRPAVWDSSTRALSAGRVREVV